MEEHINDIRRKELKLLKKSYIVRNIMDSFNTACPFLVALFSFGTYVLSSSSHKLTPQTAFVSLTLFNQLRSPMVMITLLINQLVQAVVSNERLKEYFIAKELDSTIVQRLDRFNGSKNVVEFADFSAAWNDTGPATLKDIDLNVVRGSLIAVVGKVGAGKSSLLSALLVRDNILFGKPFDKRKYNEVKVLSACALKPDLKILPYGDKTEIGEKGVNLSGGQKARLSLARAIYQDCDVYLLDDPLSAVDAHVGRHIFEKVLGPDGLLRAKTRILVTHRLSYLKSADEIVVLQDGNIIENGTYTVLMNQRGVFYRFVEEHRSSSESEGNDDESPNDDLNGGLENGTNHYEVARLSMVQYENEKKNSASALSSSLTKSFSNVLIKKEGIETGSVKMSVYFLYMRAASYWKSFLFILFLCGYQLIQILRSFWLSAWSDENDGYHENKMAVGWRLTVYGFLGTAESLSFLLSLVYLSFAGLAAAYNLHAPLINNLLRSPMSFYDTTPLGRILNRCSKKFYVPTSRQLKRLESTHRSPIFSHFGETIQGAASIRAFGKVCCLKIIIKLLYYEMLSLITFCYRILFGIFFAAFFAVISKEFGWVTSPGIIGVSISYALNITEVLNFAVRQISEIEANIVAVERIEEYTNTPTEVCPTIPGFLFLRDTEFVAILLVLRLHGIFQKTNRLQIGHHMVRWILFITRQGSISASVKEGEKVGIVGRTGAGKSSFTLALFRMIEPVSGKIIVDEVDIASIGLHDLRSNLTIIPQDPILFSGSLRFNLDPFQRNNDDEIWRSLELSHLKDFVSGLQGGLDYSINEGGENISVGQRQLVCLARAILRNTRMLVLDEATAAVDVETDALIQETIREYFRNCTVFTIAHRLNTIMDYDRVMVLKDGRIIEFDSPKALLCNRNSTFARMVEESRSESKKA
ncbi:unnamed protein product [Angiostrongylus costaricensis]|uniref:ABC transporter domain-containing protein n=1 Tax=Angiostrongylus costaricensis TaxID=334426 RepID=A0A158PE83_ANGCS|nr:unnamed protein product [Angiostrongylus costaricensis]